MSSTADVEALRAQFISEKEAIEEGLRGEMDGMRVAHVSAVTAASSEREAAVATLRGEIDAAEETLRGHLTAKVMKRLRNMAVAAAVAAWLEYVDNQRYRRDATKGLMKRVQNVAVASAFAGWVESVDADAAEKERLRITMTFHREMNSVQETMNTKLLESIAQKIRMRVAAKALGSWCDFTESRREMKQTTEKVLRRIKHMAVVSALEAWVELVEEKCAAAEQLKAVLKRGRNGSLSRSFGGWVSVASEKTSAQDLRNQKSRRVIERMLQLVLETSVEHWRDWTARKIFVKSKLSQVVRRIRKVALSCAFRCWVKTAHEDATEHARMAEIEALSVRFVSERETAEKSLRSEMDEILASHVSAEEALVAARDMEAGTAARTLKEVLASAESAGIEAHQRETALRRQAVEQQTALRSEAKQLEVARRSEAAELQGQAELREAGLRSEAEQRETALHSEAKEREAALQNDLQQAEEAMRRRVLASSAQKMRMHGVTKALNAWRSYARRKAITKLLTKKASLHLQHVVCTAAFAVWKQVTESAKSEKTRLGYVVKRIQQMVAAAALVTWRDWASKKVYVKQKLQQVIYRVTEMALQDTFEQWAATAHRAAYVRAIGDEAFERSVHRVVKKRFDAMVLLSRQTRRVRTVTETWGHRQTLAAYKVWAALVVEQYRLAELEAARSELQQTKETMNARIIAAAVQKMRSHNLGKAMRRWYDFFQRERAERHKTAKVIQLIKHLPLLAAVSRWVEHVTEVRVMRKKLMATVTRMQKNALSGAFMHWLTTVARTLQIRGVGERMMRWRCGLAVASSFAKWIAAVRQEVAEHEHYNVTVQRLREAHTVEIAYLLHLPQEMTVLRASHEQEREEAAGVELARQRLTEEHGAEDAEKEQHVAGLEQYVLEQAEQLGALQSEHEALVIDQAAAVASAAEMLASTIAHSAALDTALQSELGQARTEQAASVEAARQQAAASIEAAVAEQATEAAAYEEVRTLFWHFVVYCLTLWSFHHFSLRYLTFRTHIWWEWMSRSCWQRVRATWRGSKLSARKRRRWRRLQPVRARRLRWRCAGRWTR